MPPLKLDKLSIIIPAHIESLERLENLQTLLRYLRLHLGCPILLGEMDEEPRLSTLDVDQYLFFPIQSKGFHRTHILNELAKEVQTEYFLNTDTDVFFSPSAYRETYLLLEQGMDIVYPYLGPFYDIPREYVPALSAGEFPDLKDEFFLMNENSVGGAVAFNRQSFIEGGMENENFVSWGLEDQERALRFLKLGYKVAKAKGYCLHLHHPRGETSSTSNPNYERNQKELELVKTSRGDQIRSYIQSWPWRDSALAEVQ